jgi:hypothetical protein
MIYDYIKILIIIFFLVPVSLSAQDSVLVDLRDFYPEKIESAGFTLSSEQTVKIDIAAIAPGMSYRFKPYTNAWILESETRNVVWLLEDAQDADKHGKIITFKDEITLQPGNYEVYYSTFRKNMEYPYHNRPGFFERLFGRDDDNFIWNFSRRDFAELYIKITGNGLPQGEETVEQWHVDIHSNSLIDFSKLRDDRYFSKIMDVYEPVDLRIYALGEALNDGEYDFGWIKNLDNRQKIWDLNYRNSVHAGGAVKNRLSDEIISLEPGKYRVTFLTDDSHSYKRWNSAPPFDPGFWGLSIWPVNPTDEKSISILEDEKIEEKNLIVNFSRVRDKEYLADGFTLNKPLKLHIYALGEGSDGEMYDYGWIIDVKTRKRVWEMEFNQTDRAGGASKNRIFDGLIQLEPGNYQAYYVTDGSHSYRRWNASHPYDEESWGMRISVWDENYQPEDVADYDEENDESVLVRINKVGDYDRARAKFTLEEKQQVHIYAIGEGLRNKMYDYAWIEEVHTGRVVWEMTYRYTEKAGGARKNRLFDGVIFLEAGEYEVLYKTDDSHSFSGWNDRPPDDPVNWGITITRVDQ